MLYQLSHVRSASPGEPRVVRKALYPIDPAAQTHPRDRGSLPSALMRVWLDGRLVEEPEARVSVFDHGFTVGDGVFETAKVVDGVPFALTRHLQRLQRCAEGLGLPRPDEALLRQAVSATIEANQDERRPRLQRLRITYAGGVGPLGSDRSTVQPTLVVAVAPLSPPAPSIALATVPWPRNERGALAGLKTTSYAENVVALARAQRAGADEAVFADTRGRLCEGTGSNVFVVLEGQVLTPSLASGALAGVSRALVLEWSDAQEADLPIDVLGHADEVFVTSSTRDVQAVHAVDGRALAAPGPLTREVAVRFAQRASAEHDP